MGRQARTTSEASFDTQLVMEKVTLHQYVPHSPPLICSYADHGTLLRSLVSPPLQSFWKTAGIADGQRSWQEVQLLSPLQASVRFLPSMILAAILNLVTGLIVEKFPVIWLVLISSALGALAPLLMALNSPRWPYWYAAFPAQLFEPLSPDGAFSYGTIREKHRSLMATYLVIFTVGILLVSEMFPDRTQALAGAVFNTVAQFGQAVGLALIGVVSDSVTHNSKFTDKASPDALLTGYRAGFWTCTGWMILACFVGALGLRKSGRVGLKRD
jgi:hypothetical protein